MKNNRWPSPRGIAALLAAAAVACAALLASCDSEAERAYMIQFFANGGSGEPPRPITETVGENVELRGRENLRKSGHDFAGWNDRADGEGRSFQEFARIQMPAGGMRLYAQWEPRPPAAPTTITVLEIPSRYAGYWASAYLRYRGLDRASSQWAQVAGASEKTFEMLEVGSAHPYYGGSMPLPGERQVRVVFRGDGAIIAGYITSPRTIEAGGNRVPFSSFHEN